MPSMLGYGFLGTNVAHDLVGFLCVAVVLIAHVLPDGSFGQLGGGLYQVNRFDN